MNKDTKKLDFFQLNKAIEAFSENNPRFSSYHIALLWHILQTSNKLNWQTEFTLYTERALNLAGFSNSKTYGKALNALEEFGFIKITERSVNQYTKNIIKICWRKFDEALLQQRTSKASAPPQQSPSNLPSNDSALPCIIDSIDIKKRIKDNKEFTDFISKDLFKKNLFEKNMMKELNDCIPSDHELHKLISSFLSTQQILSI